VDLENWVIIGALGLLPDIIFLGAFLLLGKTPNLLPNFCILTLELNAPYVLGLYSYLTKL